MNKHINKVPPHGAPNGETMTQLPKNGLTVVDFYCGAGVGGIGTEYAGFETIFAFDNNKHAVRNFNKNVADVAVLLNAKTMSFDDIPYADVYTGGFPCKPWSHSGSGEGEDCDKHGNLAELLIDFYLYKLPKGFLIENVKGLVDRKNMPFFEKMVDRLSTEYKVKWKVIDCSEYGAPQKRERVFIIGVRKDIEGEFSFPEKSVVQYTLADALRGLPETPDGLNNHEYHDKWTLRNDEKPFVHKVPEGGNWRNLPDQDQKDFMKGAYYSSGGRTTFLSVISKDRPSRTIMSSPMGKNAAQIMRLADGTSRRFTVRESLRLQTVPDTWGFDEETPIKSQYERCSGIPSLISWKLMKNLAIVLSR